MQYYVFRQYVQLNRCLYNIVVALVGFNCHLSVCGLYTHHLPTIVSHLSDLTICVKTENMILYFCSLNLPRLLHHCAFTVCIMFCIVVFHIHICTYSILLHIISIANKFPAEYHTVFT